MTALVRYEEACRILAAARAIDEVLEIKAKSDAILAYARQAANRDLEINASEIRIRAERRIGEMMAEMNATGRLRPGGPAARDRVETPPDRPGSMPTRVTLKACGINERLAQTARGYAAIPAATFQAQLDQRRANILGGSRRVGVGLFDGAEQQVRKAERRAAREADLASSIRALPDRRYGVILADPEWRFETWSAETGMDRAAANHYPVSATEVIAARPVATIAADDCALFLWGTAPMLPDALAVMAAWSFRYVTNWVWGKDRIGTGYWNRNRHEHLLLGVRGSVPCPAPGTQWDSLILTPRGEHSSKPEPFLEMIEAYFPTVPKIELNRRGTPRDGWDAWGNEALDTTAEAA